MKSLILQSAALAASLCISSAVLADEFDRNDFDAAKPVTVAVFGDWPYSQYLLDNAHLLVNSINSDRDVSLVMHVGDIHSGSMPCTSAGILPALTTANPGWNQSVYYQFQQFNGSVVYTPGDNEWTDCHKSKQKSSGAPLKELASVRSLFFAKHGVTLGRREMKVRSQAEFYDEGYPSDSQFVENVMWQQSKVQFVTINMPGGSNNDTAAWTGTFADAAAQAQEVSERNGANSRWLAAAFESARQSHARAVVIAMQADVWDTEAALDQYTPFVKQLADLTLQFGKPVLLLNGDSHVYLTDKPLADPASTTGLIHHTQAVPNLTRIVVQGSTSAPGEWLRLTIDPRKASVFSWTNVPYCNDPATTCK